jgi:hypothetical protein
MMMMMMMMIIIIIIIIIEFVSRDPYSFENQLNCCEVVKVVDDNSFRRSIMGIH